MGRFVLRWLQPIAVLGLSLVLLVAVASVLPGNSDPVLRGTPSTIAGPTPTTEALSEPMAPTVAEAELSRAEIESRNTDPWKVSVATALPEVTVPELFDRPNGQRISFSDPLTNPTYFGTELALLVTAEADGWVEVQLPVRPNGTTAWVKVDDYKVTTHRFHAEVQLAKHRLRVWDNKELVVDTSTVVGTEETPTPLGRFYVNDLVPAEDPNGSYGPWILSLSAHSEVLDSFIDGRPVIAIHGTNRPDLLGTDNSNGCIRIPNDLVALLAETVPLGTPVEILS